MPEDHKVILGILQDWFRVDSIRALLRKSLSLCRIHGARCKVPRFDAKASASTNAV